eukprot:sb/3466629/
MTLYGNESSLFQTYFPKGIELLKGGAESGFRHVKPTEYKPRLFQFVVNLNFNTSISGTTYANTVIKEVGLYKQSLNKEDVFVLDRGLEIFQINTPKCDKDEKVKAMHYCLKLKDERCGRPKIIQVDDENPLEEEKIAEVIKDKTKKEKTGPPPGPHTNKLVKVSDESGTCKMVEIASGTLEQDQLDPNDVFIVDLEKEIFVWVGDNASSEEKKNGMAYAHTYTSPPLDSAVTICGDSSVIYLRNILCSGMTLQEPELYNNPTRKSCNYYKRREGSHQILDFNCRSQVFDDSPLSIHKSRVYMKDQRLDERGAICLTTSLADNQSRDLNNEF